MKLLTDWNRIHRLIGSADPVWIVERLVLDSLLFLRVLPSTAQRILDLGSGAGLPGVPLKIVRPDIELTMIEARHRRASFLSTVVRELALDRIRVVHARAEEVVSEFMGAFDAVVMRCAGKAERIVPLAMKMVRAGGVIVVSGPPRPSTRPDGGDWVTVAGVKPRETRRFAVIRRQEP